MANSFGKFQLIRKLGAGGMGEVFLARAGALEKPVVLKRLLPHLSRNQEFLDLFLDEARIAARLNHANVVRIHELGDVDGAWYLLMEHVAGRDLRQVTQALRHRRRKLPVGLACRIATEAAAGLDYAHRARDAQGRPLQIVHRDVSPHNVLLGFEGEVKLIDFGVAKAAGRLAQAEAEAEAGVLRGKYPYMSPEQVSAGPVDHRSDQFSLGVVLWELLAGQRLFKAGNDAQTLERVAECAVSPPSRKGEPLPGDLVEVVMTALRKDPRQRFADLAAFRGALEEVMTAQQWAAGCAELGGLVRELFPQGPPSEGEGDGGSGAAFASTSGSKAEPAAAAWGRLERHEQLALAQLSVFRGDFSIEAAEAVVSLASFPDAPWTLDVVQALREKALVRASETPGASGELRFGLVDDIRDCAAQQLEAVGPDAESQARQRLAAWLVAADRS